MCDIDIDVVKRQLDSKNHEIEKLKRVIWGVLWSAFRNGKWTTLVEEIKPHMELLSDLLSQRDTLCDLEKEWVEAYNEPDYK